MEAVDGPHMSNTLKLEEHIMIWAGQVYSLKLQVPTERHFMKTGQEISLLIRLF